MNPAQGWYPDPRPGHTNLQAYWDGQQWHPGATKLTESAEWVYWIIGIVAGLALSTVFPPAHRRVVSAAGAATMNAPNHVVERDATGCRPAHPCPPAPWRAPHPAP